MGGEDNSRLKDLQYIPGNKKSGKNKVTVGNNN